MHSYSIDSEERKIIMLILAVISILLDWSFYQILNNFKVVLPWWIESPSVLFFYGLLYTVFDNCVWEYFKRVGFIKTPNLNGEWIGFLETSYNGNTSKIKATFRIFQTWTKIKIILKTKQSTSHSETASIITQAPEGKYLSYQYFNEPEPNAIKTMNIHCGTSRLLFDAKNDTLSGDYYSGRGRQNFGCISLKRQVLS